MEWQDCKMITIDLIAHTVLFIENKTGNMLSQFPYPAKLMPTFLAVNDTQTKACLAAKRNEEGCLFILNLHTAQSYQLPVTLPAPLQITLDPDFKNAYFVSHTSTLYHLDLVTLSLKAFAQPSGATCVGIYLSKKRIYTAWETEGTGIIAVFSIDGEFLYEYKVSGIPTNICVNEDKIYVPFTQSNLHGEGLAILAENQPPIYLSIQPAGNANAPHIYPCNVTIDEEKNIAYVVNEDSGSITMVNLTDHTICDYFAVGRSITNLYLLPDTRFAVATSNMFADLSLLDLVNRRLLSITSNAHELSAMLAILK